MNKKSRIAMHVPFSTFQERTEEVDKKKDLNPEVLKDVHPVGGIGNVYPDLYSQAMYLAKDVDTAKADMIEILADLFLSQGDEAVNIAIESIENYTSFFLALDADPEEEYTFSKKGLRQLESGVYCRAELAKAMLALYFKIDRLHELKKQQDLTQKNILL